MFTKCRLLVRFPPHVGAVASLPQAALCRILHFRAGRDRRAPGGSGTHPGARLSWLGAVRARRQVTEWTFLKWVLLLFYFKARVFWSWFEFVKSPTVWDSYWCEPGQWMWIKTVLWWIVTGHQLLYQQTWQGRGLQLASRGELDRAASGRAAQPWLHPVTGACGAAPSAR